MKQLQVVLVSMLMLLLGTSAAFAQKRTISGKISDASGKPIPSVTVTVKGSSIGTTSNNEGVYSITVPDKAKTLVFSYVGYKPQEIDIADRSAIDVALEQGTGELANVVVNALGIQRSRKAVQYSITQVGGENLTQAREISVANALERRVEADIQKWLPFKLNG